MATGMVLWPSVCGNNSPENIFWDTQTTWNTSTPDVTQCFQDTVLAWVPCAQLWLCAPFYVAYLTAQRKHGGIRSSWSKLNAIKLLGSVSLTFISLATLVYGILHFDGSKAKVISASVNLVTMIFVTCLMRLEYTSREISSGVTFCFWLLETLFGVLTLRSYIVKAVQDTPVDVFWMISFYSFYALCVVEFVCHLFADNPGLKKESAARVRLLSNGGLDNEKDPLLAANEPRCGETVSQVSPVPCPEQTAPFWSRLLFVWVGGLLFRGFKHPLTGKDLWNLRPEDKTGTVICWFYRAWLRAASKAPRERKTQPMTARRGSSNGRYNTFGEVKVLPAHARGGDQADEDSIDETCSAPSEKEKTWQCGSSVIYALIRAFGPFYFLIGFFEIFNIILTFVRPQLLDLLINYVESDDTWAWHGYFYVSLFFGINVLRGLVAQQHAYGKLVSGIRVRGALTAAVYRKSMRLSSKVRGQYSVGEITNLMQVDAQRVADASFFLHNLWSGPVNIIVAMVFLWRYLGPASLAGLAALIILLVFNGFVASIVKKLQFKILRFKDQRTKLTNEVLSGIKVIKLYAWEKAFQQKLLGFRKEEVKLLRKAAYLLGGTAISFTCTPLLYAVAAFTVYILTSGEALTPQVAFVSLSLVNGLTAPMAFLPNALATIVQAFVSIKRLNTFLNSEELDDHAITHVNHEDGTAVDVRNGTFSWDDGTSTALRSVNLRVQTGKLVAVVGHVGSGKSSLIAAMLGDLFKVEGKVNINGSVAYVPQEAWVRNETLQKNILFGSDYRKVKYDRILGACALTPDLTILPAGDQTEIGEKGINLSGGQKQRVSIARALYQNADIYFLDDPLSAVDSHVGSHIFEHVIGRSGLLRHKTRVLITHSVSLLPQVDEILVLRDGEISERGSYRELLDRQGAFAEFLTTYLKELEEEDSEEESAETDFRRALRRKLSVISGDDDIHSDHQSTKKTRSNTRRRTMRRRHSSRSSDKDTSLTSRSIELQAKKAEILSRERLIEAEKSQEGSVKWSILGAYFKAGGYLGFLVLLLTNCLSLMGDVSSNIWLSLWSDDTSVDQPESVSVRLGVYGGIGLAQTVVVLTMTTALSVVATRAAWVLHFNLLDNVIRAPMSFFDTTPMGRVLNRFSQDINIIDASMRLTLFVFLRALSSLLATLVGITYTTPIFLAALIPLIICYYFVQRFYIVTSNQLRRIMSVRTSPIYSHFGESIVGVTSIRAYGAQDRFIGISDRFLDDMQMARFASTVSNRWLSIRLEFLGSFVVFFATLFAVLSRDTISGGLVGLSVSYSLLVTDRLSVLVQYLSDLETNVVAVERIMEYTCTKPEASWEKPDHRPPRGWPATGRIEFNAYSTRYRDGLDLVLKDIEFKIEPQEKLGVVGRTGAGKSSMMLSLFRIIESAKGSISIDGVRLDTLGLHDVRSKLTSIPQDPVLFSGSVRFNLDPFDTHSDSEIWTALEQAHLKPFLTSLPGGIDYICAEGGQNLSVGQRQLVCLARALLRKSQVLLLDEATAAVDMETDELIQRTIRSEFKQCTVLTIAHRLNTIVDYDRVMVLDGGTIKELGPPSQLLNDKDSLFYSMAKEAGLV